MRVGNSRIAWCDATLNPTVGCEKVSPGCSNCYAIGVAHRGLSESHRGLTIRTDAGLDWTGEVRLFASRFSDPLWRRRRPARIFVGSMSDVFHPGVPFDFLAQLFAAMSLSPQHTFMLLTKRPVRLRNLTRSRDFVMAVDEHRGGPAGELHWPLPNVWCGTSIESPDNLWRGRVLRQATAAVRFWSVEPLLAPLPNLDLLLTGEGRPDWVIVGGESGGGARRMDLGWAADVLGACRRAGVARFVKQLGAVQARELGLADRKGATVDEWPPEFRVQEFPR